MTTDHHDLDAIRRDNPDVRHEAQYSAWMCSMDARMAIYDDDTLTPQERGEALMMVPRVEPPEYPHDERRAYLAAVAAAGAADALQGDLRMREHMRWLDEQRTRTRPEVDVYTRRARRASWFTTRPPVCPPVDGTLSAIMHRGFVPMAKVVAGIETQLDIIARRGTPALRRRVALVARPICVDPEDHPRGKQLLYVRRLLGRAISLGLPPSRTRTALSTLAEALADGTEIVDIGGQDDIGWTR